MNAKKIKFIAAGIIIVLMGIIISQNFKEQEVYILFASIRMPISLLLILTFAIGMIAGWVATLLLKKKPKN